MAAGARTGLASLVTGACFADLGNEVVPEPSPERRQILQKATDEFHQRFRQVVTQARPGINAADSELFDGRIFTAQQALQHHLIDRIGYLDDAIAAARELAHVEPVRVVLYHRCNDRAHSAYAVTPNVPLQNTMLPVNVPGLDRSRLPTFLSSRRDRQRPHRPPVVSRCRQPTWPRAHHAAAAAGRP